MIKSRSEEIEKAIDGAKRANDLALHKLEAAQEKLSRFQKEKESLLREAELEIERLREKSQGDLETLLQRIKLENEERIQEEIKTTLEALKQEFSKKIITLSEKILRGKLLGHEEQFLDTYVDHLKGASWQKEQESAMPKHS